MRDAVEKSKESVQPGGKVQTQLSRASPIHMYLVHRHRHTYIHIHTQLSKASKGNGLEARLERGLRSAAEPAPSPLTPHRSPSPLTLTAHPSPLTPHRSPLTAHRSPRYADALKKVSEQSTSDKIAYEGLQQLLAVAIN